MGAVAPPFVSLHAATPPPARRTVGRTAAGTSPSPGARRPETHKLNSVVGKLLKTKHHSDSGVIVSTIHHFVFLANQHQ